MAERRRTAPWKRIYGKDRRFTARVDRAIERGQYTEPEEKKGGHPSQAPAPQERP